MKTVLRSISVFCIAICTLSVSFPLRAQAISARAYALIDQASGRVISCGNENSRMPMASTTKIMTALIAVESGKLDNSYVIPPEPLKVEGSSMGLQAGEQLTLRELVYGLMLESGNDAANTIAFLLAGSNDDFAKRMNDRAQALGLVNTHFCNPSGLDNKDHYTTALDLAKLAAYAMKNPDFAQIVGTEKIRISYNGIKNGRTLCNHNRLLSIYGGTIGVKTGFTKKCGRCLVSCAKRGDVELVAVTLNDPDDWKDHSDLLDSGFKELEGTQLLSPTAQYAANVVGGLSDRVAVYFDKETTAALKPGEQDRVKTSVELDRFYYAPIQKDQILGHVVFTIDGVKVAQTDIKASHNVAAQQKPENAQNFFAGLWQKITSFFAGLFHK